MSTTTNQKHNTKYERLLAHDLQIIRRDPNDRPYCQICQPVSRHPVVHTVEEFREMIAHMRNKAVLMRAAGVESVATELQAALQSMSQVLIYRGNVYSGPPAYCADCDEALTTAGVANHQGHLIWKQNPDKLQVGLTVDGYPCLFTRSQTVRLELQNPDAVHTTIDQV